MQLPQAQVASENSLSPLEQVYKTDTFLLLRDNNVTFHIAENLVHLRRFRGKSQADVARDIGTSQSAIARLESGQGNITLNTLERVIIALRGRFQISIQPEELLRRPVLAWWNLPAATSWTVLNATIVTWTGKELGYEQAFALARMERRTDIETITKWPAALNPQGMN